MPHLLSAILLLSYFEDVAEINPPSAYVQTDRSLSPAEKVLISSYEGLAVKCSVKQGPLAFDDLFPWSI